MADKVSPRFRSVVKAAHKGEIFVPIFRSYLMEGNFPSFNIESRGWKENEREPDGWFHPSTHPTMDDRQLYYYMTEPTRMIKEQFDSTSIMAMVAGTFWHAFIQMAGLDIGLITDVEVGVEDETYRSRGSMDGLLSSGDALEIKTMALTKMGNITDVFTFMLKCPEYYAQAQEYLRMSGRDRMVVVLVNTAYPFEMREIHVPYNASAANETCRKYTKVLQAIADQRPPAACCMPKSKESRACMARTVCPIALVGK